MILLKTLDELKKEKICLTIGNFDGVHFGHKKIIKEIRRSNPKLKILILTFIPHPLKIIKELENFLINTYEERRCILEKEDVDFLFEIPFDKGLSLLSPEEFTKKFLSPINHLEKIIVGYNFTFGLKKSGDFLFLKSFFKDSPVEVEILKEYKKNKKKISSTKIRKNLSQGLIEEVNRMLDREYFIKGKVIKSTGKGREIGYPTANICYERELLIPKNGVYETKVKLKKRYFDSITNIGFNPTFNQKDAVVIETYILDFKSDLYGETIEIFFYSRIRDEKKFPTKMNFLDK